MSLTSYRAAPPRVMFDRLIWRLSGEAVFVSVIDEIVRDHVAFCRPGSDLLSRVLRRSTIGAGAFHGRVRNGNGCSHPAITTRSAKRKVNDEKLVRLRLVFEHVCRRCASVAWWHGLADVQDGSPSPIVWRAVRSAIARQDRTASTLSDDH